MGVRASWTLESLQSRPVRLTILGAVSVLALCWLGESAALLPTVKSDAWLVMDIGLRWLRPFVPDSSANPTVVVAEDDASLDDWNLFEVLRAIIEAHPKAIVVDFDLSGNATQSAKDNDAGLQGFLKDYNPTLRGPPGVYKPPLVFVKRLREKHGRLLWDESKTFDGVVGNQLVRWGHARYRLDSDGVARRWNDALAVCKGDDPITLSSVAVAALTAVAAEEKGAGLLSAELPTYDGSEPRTCDKSQLAVANRIVWRADRPPESVSAIMVQKRLVDPHFLNGKYVVVGATHHRSGDIWLTSAGSQPGVYLLADTFRFAAAQLRDPPFHRLGATLLIVWFVVGRIFLRRSLAWSTFVLAVFIYAEARLRRSHFNATFTVEVVLFMAVQIVLMDDVIEWLTHLRQSVRERWPYWFLRDEWAERTTRALELSGRGDE